MIQSPKAWCILHSIYHSLSYIHLYKFFFPLFPFSICYNVIRFVSIICINLTIHPYSLLLGLQTGTTVMEMSVENSQKRLKTDLSHYPATPPLSIYPKTAYSIDTFSAMFSAALDTAATKRK